MLLDGIEFDHRRIIRVNRGKARILHDRARLVSTKRSIVAPGPGVDLPVVRGMQFPGVGDAELLQTLA